MSRINFDRRTFLGAATASLGVMAAGRVAMAQDGTFSFITPFSFSLAFAPVLYAEAAGYFAENGLKMQLEAAKGASMVSQMVIAGQMDCGRTGGTNMIMSCVNNKAPLISIGTIAQVSPFYVISAADNPAKAVADLKGRTIGMASLGGSMEGTLDLLLSGAGISPKEVKKVKVADSAASVALIEAGRAGAFIGNTSSMVAAKAASPNVVSLAMDDGMPGQVYIAAPAEVQKAPDRFVAFLKATHRAASEIVDAPDKAQIIKTIADKFDLSGAGDPKIAAQDLEANAANWMAKGRENLLRNVPEVWAGAVQTMHKAGMIKTAPDPTTLYTNALLDKALAS